MKAPATDFASMPRMVGDWSAFAATSICRCPIKRSSEFDFIAWPAFIRASPKILHQQVAQCERRPQSVVVARGSEASKALRWHVHTRSRSMGYCLRAAVAIGNPAEGHGG